MIIYKKERQATPLNSYKLGNRISIGHIDAKKKAPFHGDV
jgi:hypothetical protein